MSYPLTLQTLVIEDEVHVKEAYERIFEGIAPDLPCTPAPPCFAFSYEEAVERLESRTIFHVVILDLRLPEKFKLPARHDIDLGVSLLTRCVDRDPYPIPALLVISAHMDQAEQTRMLDTLRGGFYYGRPVVKGPNLANLEEEIRRACNEAIRYCAVGIHLWDAGERPYPTISPRDEDLLRRSVLQQPDAIGLDLSWWAAKRGQAEMGSGSAFPNTWTKVLRGRYLLGSGVGASRPMFFKLLPGADAHFVIPSAQLVQQKLSHIKITSTVTSRSAALIVTEKCGGGDTEPKSLEDFFQQGTPEQAANVARQICGQVEELGDLLQEHKPVKSLFWETHCKEILAEQWNRLSGKELQGQIGSSVDPISLYTELTNGDGKLHVKERSLVHGDLHIHNVAVDMDADGEEAFIFDPGVIKRNIAGRDLAVLEVSVLLHQRIASETFSQICLVLYAQSGSGGEGVTKDIADPVGKAIVSFILGLRKAAQAWNDLEVYALMVFDFVLIQVGGLAFGSSGNKIIDPRAAGHLLAVTSQWCQSLTGSKNT